MLLLASVGSAAGQFLASGSVAGVVRDEAGEPVFDVIVTLDPVRGGIERSDTTTRDGRFSISFLPPGNYDVIAERLGFRPQRLTGVEVMPGRRLALAMEIVAVAQTPQSVDVVAWDGGIAAALSAGLSTGVQREQLEALPWATRDLIDANRVTSFLGPDLESRGLPGQQTGIFLDGIPVRGGSHPLLGGGSARTSVMPVPSIDRLEVLNDFADVEFSGFLGSAIGVHGRTGRNEMGVNAWIDGTAGALQSSSNYDAADGAGASIRGGAVVEGPILSDTAQFLVGLEYERSEIPRGPLVDGSASAASASILERLGDSYAGLGAPFAAAEQSFTGFGTMDWQVTDLHRVFARASFGAVTESASGLPGGGLETTSSGTDFVLAGGISSRVGEASALEFRVGLDRTDRDYETAEDALATPYTAVASGGAPFGVARYINGSFKNTLLSVGETFHHLTAGHQFKMGAGMWLMSNARTVLPTGRSYYFSDPADIGGQGLLVAATGVSDPISYSSQQYFVFLQDRWELTPEFEVLIGVRGELERLPLSDIPADAEWDAVSGIDNEKIPDQPDFKPSPRIGFRWDVGGEGRYFVRGTGGVYYGMVDPDAFAEVIANTGSHGTRITTGSTGWPDGTGGGTTWDGRSLTILARDFRAPRSERGSVGLGVALGGGVAFDVAGSFARVTGLPRRSDLNRLPGTIANDMDGRPIHGVLVQDGSLLYAMPGSNRRFQLYDRVYVMESKGESETVSVSAGLERRSASGTSIFARYTFSRTTDDWLNAGLAPWGMTLSPFGDDDPWNDGTGDSDVPHRLVAGLNLTVPNVPVRAGAFYRFSSGRPFTPGFPPGVDANGDGVFGNDPAFIGSGIPTGTDVTCDSPSGDFAERNSCRDPATHRLDLRAAVDLPLGTQGRFMIFVDALNVLDSELALRDHALYRIDPTRTISGGSMVTVPLVANPDFGSPLVQLSPGRTLRLGLQVRY